MTTERLERAIDAYRRADSRRAAAEYDRVKAEADERAAIRAYEDARAELLAANEEAFK